MEGQMVQQPGERDEGCSICTKPAVARLTFPDRLLCADHFRMDCEERVKSAIMTMIAPGDRIAVGLSGGKDSTALLLILTEILDTPGDVSLTAITIDEGINGYREETRAAAKSLTRQLGINQIEITFSELYGHDLDVMLTGRENEACTVCGVLRRRALLEGARRAGATKIATGHNLDDESQSVLMNVLRGDLPRLVMDTASGYPDCFIPRIKPLSPLSEKEIVIYLMVRGAFPDLPECPYAHTALRGEVREMIAELELHHPGTKMNLVTARDRIRELFGGDCATDALPGSGLVTWCRRCGEVCSGDICSVCRVLTELPMDF